jgi:hypothetical protein
MNLKERVMGILKLAKEESIFYFFYEDNLTREEVIEDFIHYIEENFEDLRRKNGKSKI